MTQKVWLITGASRGFGRIWAEAALARGDQVAATARDTTTLHALVDRYGDQVLPLALDVTDREAVTRVVGDAISRFGRLDVVINNAGYGQFGAVEEISEAEARAQMETNFFGALWVTQAVLPQMRAQRSGHILQVSSIGGVNSGTTTGIYHASKWALEGLSQTLAQEVAPFGIKVTLVEPLGYATDWASSSAKRAAPMDIYDDTRAARVASRRNLIPGDPQATAEAILKLVDAERPPLRLLLGKGGLEIMQAEYARRLKTWQDWNDVAVAAHGAA